MRKKIISFLACPKCQGSLELEEKKETKERVMEGKLWCDRCSVSFFIKNGVGYFLPSKAKSMKQSSEMVEKLFMRQEVQETWKRLFSKEELSSLEKEWRWMLSDIKKTSGSAHIDFATGTGRFLRSVISETKGEIVTLDLDYSTCVGLQNFLKKIKKYKRVSIICTDARLMPFRKNVFDNASSWHGLDEPHIGSAIRETRRVLKRDGVFVVSGTEYKKKSKSFIRAKKEKIDFLSKIEAERIFKNVGFRNVISREFFKGRWDERGSYLPIYGEEYMTYVVQARK